MRVRFFNLSMLCMLRVVTSVNLYCNILWMFAVLSHIYCMVPMS